AMRALAEFALRSKGHSFFVALALSFTPFLFWLGVAVAAVVVLRRGLNAGAYAVAGVIIPAGMMWQWGDPTSLFQVIVALAAAITLRATVSLPSALVALTVMSAVSLFGLQYLAADKLQQMIHMNQEMLDRLQSAQVVPAMEAQEAQQWLASFTLGAAVVGLSWMSLFSLLMARGWQAQLFNPGGFQQEFHSLRIPKSLLPILGGLAALLLLSTNAPAVLVLALAGMPLMLAALGLIHCIVKRKQMNSGWLIALYGFAVITLGGPLVVPLIALGVLDSLLDMRRRIQPSAQ
ncbi:MAG TPA: hypothetical protein VFM46_12010, partial [Pseudomonadales bacterium]|nr:hypothetical protein [Pseudomonadales bacterium]